MVYALGLGLVPKNRQQSTVNALLKTRVNGTNFAIDAFGAWLIGNLVQFGCGEEVGTPHLSPMLWASHNVFAFVTLDHGLDAKHDKSKLWVLSSE